MSENLLCSNVTSRVATGAIVLAYFAFILGAIWIGLDPGRGSLALLAGALVFLPAAYAAGRVAEWVLGGSPWGSLGDTTEGA